MKMRANRQAGARRPMAKTAPPSQRSLRVLVAMLPLAGLMVWLLVQ